MMTMTITMDDDDDKDNDNNNSDDDDTKSSNLRPTCKNVYRNQSDGNKKSYQPHCKRSRWALARILIDRCCQGSCCSSRTTSANFCANNITISSNRTWRANVATI